MWCMVVSEVESQVATRTLSNTASVITLHQPACPSANTEDPLQLRYGGRIQTIGCWMTRTLDLNALILSLNSDPIVQRLRQWPQTSSDGQIPKSPRPLSRYHKAPSIRGSLELS